MSFGCKVEISTGWEYRWYKNKDVILQNSNRLDISNVTMMRNGLYWCMATRNKTNYSTEESDKQKLNVSGELKFLCFYVSY